MSCEEKSPPVYIWWSCSNLLEAKKIVHALLEKSLIGCASLLPETLSIYFWEGEMQETKEVKVILKTVSKHFESICQYIANHGSYEIPEIMQVEISQGNPPYLDWIARETSLDDVDIRS